LTTGWYTTYPQKLEAYSMAFLGTWTSMVSTVSDEGIWKQEPASTGRLTLAGVRVAGGAGGSREIPEHGEAVG
jgi:hypothetical protein